ncbi:primosomal protein N', partial [human gut metagenome]
VFPEARVARLDRDSVTSERAFNAIIADFAERRTDILVGTQMITKGFDFGGVSLVGILKCRQPCSTTPTSGPPSGPSS